jgi:hypothetical protein
VVDDFGRIGRAWRETDYATTDLETVIQDLLTGQYNPIRVVAFNTAEDASEDVALEWKGTTTRISVNCPFDWPNSHFVYVCLVIPAPAIAPLPGRHKLAAEHPFMNLTTRFRVFSLQGDKEEQQGSN